MLVAKPMDYVLLTICVVPPDCCTGAHLAAALSAQHFDAHGGAVVALVAVVRTERTAEQLRIAVMCGGDIRIIGALVRDLDVEEVGRQAASDLDFTEQSVRHGISP